MKLEIKGVKVTYIMLSIHYLLKSLKSSPEETPSEKVLKLQFNSFIIIFRGWPLVSLNICWAVQCVSMVCSVHHWLVFVQFLLVCLVGTDRVARLVTLSQSNVRQGLERLFTLASSNTNGMNNK